MTIEFLLGDLSLGRDGVQRKPLLELAVYQVPSAPNHQYTKAAYFGVSCPKLLQVAERGSELRCFPYLQIG